MAKFDKVMSSNTHLNMELVCPWGSFHYILNTCFASCLNIEVDCLVVSPQSCVAAFLDVVIGGRAVETPPMSSMNLLEGLSRTVAYMTHSQLLCLVRS